MGREKQAEGESRISVRVTNSLKERLERAAVEEDRTSSNLLRMMLERWLDDRDDLKRKTRR